MTKARLDQAFLGRQQRKLLDLREQLKEAAASGRAEETAVNADSGGEAREFEDDAQKLTTLELEGNLQVRDSERLASIERALRKIDEGTYGTSDESGEPIPAARLEVVPDAIYTLAEQETRDSRGKGP